MAFTETDLSNIEAAIATGELTVEVSGRRVTYRSVEELRMARNLIRGDLQSSGSSPSPARVSYVTRIRS